MPKWVTIFVISVSPGSYLAISPSDFCVTSRILLSKTNSMGVVWLGIQTKEQVTMKLYWGSDRFSHGSVRTHLETTTM